MSLPKPTLACLVVLALALSACPGSASTSEKATLLNVSFEPTRAMYEEINAAFARRWHDRTGQRVEVLQSHGGSGKQARAVIEGLPADVVTLGLGWDIDAIHRQAKLLPQGWRERLPRGSVPFATTIVFVVRRGNPRQIRDWDDLAGPGVSVVLPNPKTSGGARWNYLAAWGWALRRHGGDAQEARRYVERLYANAPVLDAGARASSTTFAQRGIGDVLVTWESEAHELAEKLPELGLEIVVPTLSISAEPPVALVERNADRHGTRAVAQAWLEFLYSDEAQAIAARHHFRTAGAGAPTAQVERFTVDEVFGGWSAAQQAHFAEGATFDQIFRPGRR